MLKENRLELSTLIKVIGSLILLIAIVSYVAFQARFLIMGPQITLDETPNTEQNMRIVTLSGKAFNISRLWLNDRQIYTDENGYFKEALVLENSYTISTLRATDRYGRETSVTKSFVYTPISFIQ
jgi:hypothetical protein